MWTVAVPKQGPTDKHNNNNLSIGHLRGLSKPNFQLVFFAHVDQGIDVNNVVSGYVQTILASGRNPVFKEFL